MRALLIDPLEKRITEVQHDESSESLASLLKSEIFEVLGGVIGLAKGDALYVDQEGLIRPDSDQRGSFNVKGLRVSIIGRALVCGHTVDGEMCDARTKLNTVKRIVWWSR
jgi:hypothetical protein